jgi:hypothetical protein
MSDLTPSGGRRVSRRSREDRAFKLVLAGGAAGAVTVVGFVLAIAGVIGFVIPMLAAVVAALCALMFRSTVARR